MSFTAALGAVGSIAGGSFGNSAAKKAAETQANIAQNQLGVAVNIHQNTNRKFAPYRDSGNRARRALDFELGLRGRPTFGRSIPKIVEITDDPVVQQEPQQQGFGISPRDRHSGFNPGGFTNALAPQDPVTRFQVGDEVFDTRDAATEYAQSQATGGRRYKGFQETPGYQFQLDQGLDAIDNSAASRGNLFSGATLKAAQGFGQGLANQEYNNYLNRLTAQANSGQAAAANQANAGTNLQTGITNALANQGNAQSAGIIGGANALTNGFNNAFGIINYQNQLANNGGGFFNGLFSGPAPGSTASFI